jgi:hypothetical protein
MRRRRGVGVAVLVVAALALLLAGTGRAQAGFVVTLLEQSGNVVATGSGTFDLTSLSSQGTAFNDGYIAPSTAQIMTGPNLVNTDLYTGFVGPTSFGSGGIAFASSGGGDIVGLANTGVGRTLEVPQGYASGTLSDTATYSNETFAKLGVTPGTYVWTWGAGAHKDSFTLQVGPAATAAPEPASLTLLATGALGLLGYGWRRRKAG